MHYTVCAGALSKLRPPDILEVLDIFARGGLEDALPFANPVLQVPLVSTALTFM